MPEKPKTWAMGDIPSPTEMEEYLSRIRATRAAFPGVSGFPELPGDMDHLTTEVANDLERVLLMVNSIIGDLVESRIYSGELQAGGC